MLRKLLIYFGVLLNLALLADYARAADVNFTASLHGYTSSPANAYINLVLVNCGAGNIPTTATDVKAVDQQVLRANSSGIVAAKVTPNADITCGAVLGATRYRVEIYKMKGTRPDPGADAPPLATAEYVIGPGDFNLSTASPVSPAPAPASSIDFGSYAATRPFRRLAFANFPASCTVGKDWIERSDPAVAGEVLYRCNATGNGWDLVGDGGAGSGGSMTWPGAAGVAVYGGSSAWGTSITWNSGTSTITGNVSGSAATLATPRAINGQNFDGSGPITVPVNNANDTTTNATMYPLWTATAGGNYAAKVSTTKLSFNPSTGLFSTPALSVGSVYVADHIHYESSPGVPQLDLDIGGLGLSSMGAITASASATTSDSADTGLSRGAAGQWNFGNGTAGDFSGTAKATTFIGALSGNVTGNVSGTAASITGALALANMPLTTRGDLLVANTATPVLARLAKGTQYQTLQGGASDLGWDALHLDQATAITGSLPWASQAHTAANVVGLWTACTGYLKNDGTCDVPGGAGTVTHTGNLNATSNAVPVGSGVADLTASTCTITAGVLTCGLTGNVTGNVSGTAASITGSLTGDVTSSAMATTLANIPTTTPAAGSIIHTNIAAPASPSAGKDSVYSDSTDLRLHDKNASGVIGTTVVADAGASNNFLTAISAAGAISKAQPTWANINKATSSIADITTRTCSTLSDGATGCSTTVGTAATKNVLGTGTNVATTSASAPASNKCVEFDTSGNLVVAGTNTTCGSGGGMTWPAAAGIAVYAGASAWGTSLTAPTGALVGAGQANTYSTGAQDFGAATSLKVPTAAGATPAAIGLIAYDSTANTYKGYNAAATKTFAFTDSNITGTAAGLTAAYIDWSAGSGGASIQNKPATYAPTAHNLLSASHGDTATASAVRGDGLFAVGATPTWQHVAHSATSGGYFKWNGTDIVASTNAAAGTGSCTNGVVTAENADGAPTCTTADTTTTHAMFATAGAPAFRAIAAGDIPAALSSTTSVNGTSVAASKTLVYTDTAILAAQMPALTGAVTTSAGAVATTAGKRDLADASAFCAAAGASSTSYTCNLTPAVTAYVTGTHYRFKADVANTAASTINFNGVAAATIKKAHGAITTDVAANDFRAGQWVDLVYDGTNMQMQSTLGNAPGTMAANGTSGNLIKSAAADKTQADAGILAADVVTYHTPAAGLARTAAGSQAIAGTELSGDVTTSGTNATTMRTGLNVRTCDLHIWGSGASSVLQDADDEVASCLNKYGVTWTITYVGCWANAGSPTVMITKTAGNNVLSGNLTCGTASWASGSLTGTGADKQTADGGTLDANIVSAGGTATNIRIVIAGTI